VIGSVEPCLLCKHVSRRRENDKKEARPSSLPFPKDIAILESGAPVGLKRRPSFFFRERKMIERHETDRYGGAMV
jgi:hypothetical protein